MLHFADFTDANVFIEAQVVADKVLKNYSDVAAHRYQVIFAEVHAIQQDAPFAGIVETRQQFCEGCFAGAVFAHQGNLLFPLNAQVQVPDCPCVAAGITEADIVEHHFANRRRHRTRIQLRHNVRPHPEKREQVLHVEALLVDVAGRQKRPFADGPAAQE